MSSNSPFGDVARNSTRTDVLSDSRSISEQVQQEAHASALTRDSVFQDVSHIGDSITLPAPERPSDGEFSMEGPVWVITLNNEQTQALAHVLTISGNTLALAAGPFWAPIAAALNTSIGYIHAINRLGGNNGVEINGVIGTHGVIVTPRVGKLYGELIKAARVAVSGRTIIDFVIQASAHVPALAAALQIPVAASVFAAVASGTPLGWAIAGAVGLAVKLFEPEPDPNAHGAVLADRDQPLEWESFILGQIGDGSQVCLLSWQGLFSAQGGGGHGVYANRPQVLEWETWTLIDNGDGTVSLRTINGHYLCAEEGGGRECQANRTAIGDWEKFYLVNLPNGKVALRTRNRGKYVSVQA